MFVDTGRCNNVRAAKPEVNYLHHIYITGTCSERLI